MATLIGYTGYVGSELMHQMNFDALVNRSNLVGLENHTTKLLVCAGLPAQKWLINQNPGQDLDNLYLLKNSLKSVEAEEAILISTIDVYQPPLRVTEKNMPNLNGPQAYGRNRALFENEFLDIFPLGRILRLPGLFSKNLRKNLIYDLLNRNLEQLVKVSRFSEYQYFNLDYLSHYINFAIRENIRVLNISTEPILADEIASLFSLELGGDVTPVKYNMLSDFADGGSYFFNKSSVLTDIELLREATK
jgi:hypothetical protein